MFSVVITLLCAEVGSAQLWQRRVSQRSNLIRDIRANGIGDSLTVLITENTDVENIDLRTMEKSTSNSANGAIGYGFGGDIGTSNGNASLNNSSASSRSFDGNSNFRSERAFQDRFTVTVIDKFPNGNLLISGRRVVQINGDHRVLNLSGIVRGIDISSGNLVSSQLIANLQVKYEPKGDDKHFIKQGWAGKKFNKIWPF